jgi:thioredoxin-like negative regulator of GroEL
MGEQPGAPWLIRKDRAWNDGAARKQLGDLIQQMLPDARHSPAGEAVVYRRM